MSKDIPVEQWEHICGALDHLDEVDTNEIPEDVARFVVSIRGDRELLKERVVETQDSA